MGLELTVDHLADVEGMTVRRALPRRQRRTVGAWCFLDHFGPVGVAPSQPVGVGPHPHTGLATVTWLLSGEQLHRDSLGSEQLIRPGQLNLMHAGHGIAHAEESLGYTGEIHGAQLWVALPDATRSGPAAFEHHGSLPSFDLAAGVGTWLLGGGSPARADTPLVGIDLDLRAGASEVALDVSYEHALVVLSGSAAVEGEPVEPGVMAYLGTGRASVAMECRAPVRALIVGGAPFDEPVAMSWNFVARTKDELDAAHADWISGDDRFGPVASDLPRIASPRA